MATRSSHDIVDNLDMTKDTWAFKLKQWRDSISFLLKVTTNDGDMIWDLPMSIHDRKGSHLESSENMYVVIYSEIKITKFLFYTGPTVLNVLSWDHALNSAKNYCDRHARLCHAEGPGSSSTCRSFRTIPETKRSRTTSKARKICVWGVLLENKKYKLDIQLFSSLEYAIAISIVLNTNVSKLVDERYSTPTVVCSKQQHGRITNFYFNRLMRHENAVAIMERVLSCLFFQPFVKFATFFSLEELLGMTKEALHGVRYNGSGEPRRHATSNIQL